MSAGTLLAIDGVSLSFAGVRALRDVSLEIGAGEVVAIIGPNGAGKTSLFNCISGVYRPQEGDIRFKGTSLMGQQPHAITTMGVGRMFQKTSPAHAAPRPRADRMATVLVPSLTFCAVVSIGA